MWILTLIFNLWIQISDENAKTEFLNKSQIIRQNSRFFAWFQIISVILNFDDFVVICLASFFIFQKFKFVKSWFFGRKLGQKLLKKVRCIRLGEFHLTFSSFGILYYIFSFSINRNNSLIKSRNLHIIALPSAKFQNSLS